MGGRIDCNDTSITHTEGVGALGGEDATLGGAWGTDDKPAESTMVLGDESTMVLGGMRTAVITITIMMMMMSLGVKTR